MDGERDENNPNLIRVNVTKAYEIALKRYHGWFVQQLFKVKSESYPKHIYPVCVSSSKMGMCIFVCFQAALFAAPYKSDFLKALSKGRDVKEEECLEKVKKFLINFSATVDVIYEMYSKMHADLDYTV